MSIIFGILPSLPPLPPSFSSFFNLSCIYRSSKKNTIFSCISKVHKVGKERSTLLISFLLFLFLELPIFLSYYSSASSPLPPPLPQPQEFSSFFLSPFLSFLALYIPSSIHSDPFFLFFITSYYHTLTTRVYHTHPTTPYYTISRHINASIYQCINVNSVST